MPIKLLKNIEIEKDSWSRAENAKGRNRLSLLIHSIFFELDHHDHYTFIHSFNVAHYAREIGRSLQLSKDDCDKLFLGGLIHDIGKTDIPNTLLNKPGRLNELEFNEIKQHTVKGYKKLTEIEHVKEEKVLLDMVLSHHERLDGSGYPYGLDGADVSLFVRVMGVADSFDAMTSNRVYRNQLGLDYAMSELERGSGSTYDVDVVSAMKELVSNERIQVLGLDAA